MRITRHPALRGVIHQPVTGIIRSQFPPPEHAIVPRPGCVLGTAKPETAIHKECEPRLPEYIVQVRIELKTCHVELSNTPWIKMELTEQAISPGVSTLRAWYSASIADFLKSPTDTTFAQLAKNNDFDLIHTQRDAWIEQIEFLRSALTGLNGAIFLEV
jgi:hypothetical protein